MYNIFFSLGGNIASKLIILLVNIISFRLLNTQSYGEISLLLAMTATVGAISNMGASVAVNSIVAKEGRTSLSSLFVKYNYVLSSVFAVILAIFIYIVYLRDIEKMPAWQVFAFLLCFSLFSSFNAISEAVLTGLQSFRIIFINNFLSCLIFLPICFYLIERFQVVGVLSSLVFYRTFLFLINFKSVKNTKLLSIQSIQVSDKIEIKQILKKFSLPVIMSGLFVAPVIGLAFKLLTTQEDGLQKLAYFNIIYQMYLVACFIPNALNGYLISHFSRNSLNRNNDFLKIAKYNLMFAILIALLLLLFQSIFFWLIGQTSVALINNYHIMLGTIVLFSLNAVFASYWPSIGKAWFGLYMNIIWAITLLLVTFVLSKYQVTEALSWAFLLSYLILSIVQIFCYKAAARARS